MPIVHISFKYRSNRMPVPAKGIIAIGQFACGVVTISQFGVGLVSVSQFTVAGFALAHLHMHLTQVSFQLQFMCYGVSERLPRVGQ